MTEPTIIDIHGHITPPELFKRLPMPPSLADIDGMIEQKARAGIGLTIVGSPVGVGTMARVPGMANSRQTPDELRRFHDWLAETVAKHPDRLRAYAYADAFGDDAALQETARTAREGGFVGLIVNTSVQGEYLDSERADGFFAMAAELGLPLLLHPPAEPVGSASFRDFRLVEQVGRFGDVTAGLAALVFGGRLEQYPDLQVIGATAGGAIALLSNRLDLAYQPRHWGGPPGGTAGGPPGPGGGRAPAGGAGGAPPQEGARPGAKPAMMAHENRITRPPSAYIKRLYVDTANASLPNQLANLAMMGAGQMLFGTDSPPLSTPVQVAIDLVNQLPIADEDKWNIFSGNARRLFKLDAGRGGA